MTPSIKWYLGQVLLPVHLEANNTSLREETFDIINSTGIPAAGIDAFQIDDQLLKMGIVRIYKFKYVSVNGEVIEKDLNAECMDFDLNESDNDVASLYINILYKDFNYKYKNEDLKCIGYTVSFSYEIDSSAVYSFKCFYVEKCLDNTWKVSDHFLPPLINLSCNLCINILSKTSTVTRKVIQCFERMNKDKEFLIKLVDFKQSLYLAYKIEHRLRNIMNGINVHPYSLYEFVSELYISLAIYFDLCPDKIMVYKHDKINTVFNDILDKIDELISNNNRPANYIRFKENKDFWEINHLSDEIVNSQELFFVVQKRNKSQIVNLDSIILSTFNRRQTLEKMALSGIKKLRLDTVSFSNYLTENSIFFKLFSGNEWDYVIRDRNLVFKNKPEFQDMKFYLYYI